MFDETVTAALLQMIEAGGTLAIWGIVAYYGMGILRVLAIGGVLCLIIRVCFRGSLALLEAYHSRKVSRISLLSEEVSKEIYDTFTGTCTVLGKATKKLDDTADKLWRTLDALAPDSSTESDD